jgi:hypothetical protein
VAVLGLHAWRGSMAALWHGVGYFCAAPTSRSWPTLSSRFICPTRQLVSPVLGCAVVTALGTHTPVACKRVNTRRLFLLSSHMTALSHGNSPWHHPNRYKRHAPKTCICPCNCGIVEKSWLHRVYNAEKRADTRSRPQSKQTTQHLAIAITHYHNRCQNYI